MNFSVESSISFTLFPQIRKKVLKLIYYYFFTWVDLHIYQLLSLQMHWVYQLVLFQTHRSSFCTLSVLFCFEEKILRNKMSLFLVRKLFIFSSLYFWILFLSLLPVNFICRLRERPLWSWSFRISIWIFNPCIVSWFPMFNACFKFTGFIIWIKWFLCCKSIRPSSLWKRCFSNSWELILALKSSFDMLVMLIILRSYHFRCFCSIDGFQISVIVIQRRFIPSSSGVLPNIMRWQHCFSSFQRWIW